MAAVFPEMYSDVQDVYNFSESTRRILIGDSYGIFYRVDEENHQLIVGSIFNQKQLHVKF
jgi:plasmid stabilization system protein ParE